MSTEILERPPTSEPSPADVASVVTTSIPPDERLLNEPAWVAWNMTPRKVPTSVPGGSPTTVDKLLAGTYAEAYKLYQDTDAEGVGLVLGTPLRSGLVSIGKDLDSCIVDGKISPWAQVCIDASKTYTEVSPSGTGVKLYFLVPGELLPAIEDLIAKSRKGGKGSRHARKWCWKSKSEHPPAIELFTSSRWFAYTCMHLQGTPAELRVVDFETIRRLVEEIGPAFEAADPSRNTSAAPDTGPADSPQRIERQVRALDRATLQADLRERLADAEKRSDTLREKIDGVFRNEDPSGSGAKHSLVLSARLAGMSKEDVKLLTELHPETAESAEKEGDRGFDRCWDAAPEPVNVAQIFQGVRPIPDADAPSPADGVPYQASLQKRTSMTRTPRRDLKNRPKRKWHYNGHLPERGVMFLCGREGSGKTFAANALEVEMARGGDWAGLDFASGEGPGLVAHYAGEGADDADDRLTAYERYQGYDETETIDIWSGPFVLNEILEAYAGKTLRLFVIDTLSKWFGALGFDENSLKDAAAAMAMLDRIRDELGCLVLVLHHPGKKGEGMRGSSAISGAADIVVDHAASHAGQVIWTFEKMRSAPKPPPIGFEFKTHGDSAVLVRSEARVLVRSSLQTPPKGEIEKLLLEIIEQLMPDSRPTVPSLAPSEPLAANLMLGALSENAVRIHDVREMFVMRRAVGDRETKTQAFKRAIRSLEKKRNLIDTFGELVQLRVPSTSGAGS